VARFIWNEDELGLGCGLLDDDHRAIIELVNDLFGAMEQARGKDALAELLGRVVVAVTAHFAREEDEMYRIQYLDAALHREEHERLTRELLDLQRKFIAGKAMLSIQASRFLNDWVFNHILHDDKQLAAALRNAQSAG
jgi:hemerythrin